MQTTRNFVESLDDSAGTLLVKSMPGPRLTRSQLRCVQLAGEGLSDKQIATRLQISHRTVQDHLQAAYEKLNVNDRWAAAEAVRRDYGEVPIRIAAGDPIGPDGRADAGSNADPTTGDGPLQTLLMTLYQALYQWARPRRLGGTLLPMILVWGLITLALLIVVLALSNALIGSANELAARAHAIRS